MSRSIAISAALALVGIAAAQYALDANQNVYGSRVNPRGPELKMGDEIYTVTSSGEMVYNRANAFRDSTYRIYQRGNIDLFRYDGPIGGTQRTDSSAGGLALRQEYSLGDQRSPLQGAPPNRPSPPVAATPPAPRHTAPNAIRPERYGVSLSQPVYSAAPAPLQAQRTGGATRLPSNRVR